MMTLAKRILVIFILLFPISNSFGSMVTEVQNVEVASGGSNTAVGLHFNTDGSKMFVLYQGPLDGNYNFVEEYTLSTPFDISTKTYAGDSERCELDHTDEDIDAHSRHFDLEFSKDGMIMFTTGSALADNSSDAQRIYRFDLNAPFDISTCTFKHKLDLMTAALQDNSLAGDRSGANNKNRVQGVEFSEDGTKMFAQMHGNALRLLEYTLSSPFDLTSTVTLVLTAGINLDGQLNNPMSIRFSNDGKRIFHVSHNSPSVTQISLTTAYDTSSFTIDGSVSLDSITSIRLNQARGIAFSRNGEKLYIADDSSTNNGGGNGLENVFEFDLVCPFNIIAGNCPSITENKDRTGMALAQIEIAKRTIDHATDSAVNRLKWIRRNKDKQNLTNLNINFNFTNERLASLTEVVKASASKVKKKNKDEDVFYWSEGSIAIGKIGDTSISSTKKIDTDAITFGADKFTEENGIQGLAFRVGRNNVDVGTGGSNLDTDTFNITYYSTTPIEDDTQFLDTFIGIGKLKSDLLTVIDGRNLTANRTGKQIYGTIRVKDEIKKDNLTFIPSGRFDIGHTILGSYKEVGTGGIDVEKQHLRTKKIRAGFAAVQDLSDDEYTLKRHGKIEYVIDIDRSSNFKYTYTGDNSINFSDTLHSGALHNINGEIGLDIVFQDNFSLFLIYERNQALGSGHTDKVHIAIGYLPNKETNYAFSITGEDNLKSNYVLSKKINDYLIDFKLTNNAMRPEEFDEASINLLRKF